MARGRLSRGISSSSALHAEAKRIMFLGTPSFAASSLRKLYESSHGSEYRVVAVVSQPPRPKGRKMKLTPSPVQVEAERINKAIGEAGGEEVAVMTPESAKDEDFLGQMESLGVDLCVTAAYGCYLPKKFLSMPPLGTVNIHPSLLPRWRGASPVQRSLEAGDAEIGVSLLYTVSKMDAGPIVSQIVVEDDREKQATQVLEELFDLGTDDLVRFLPKIISGEVTFGGARAQHEAEVSHAKMISKDEGYLDIGSLGARQLHNKVRGLEMWPGTHFFVEYAGEKGAKKKVKVGKTRVVEEGIEGGGEGDQERDVQLLRLKQGKGGGLLVNCGDGSVLEVLQIQPEAKKMMDAKSFVNGLSGAEVRWVDASSS